MPFPDATGWAPVQMPDAAPPQAVLDLLGGSFDPSRWSWDAYTSRLTDRTTGGSYDYSDLLASQNGANLVTDLSAYNASGGQQGATQLAPGATPYFGFGDSAQGYNAGLMPGSGIFASTDPNEISDYRSHANDVVGRGVAQVGALVGGAAALANSPWGQGGSASSGAAGNAATTYPLASGGQIGVSGLTPAYAGATTAAGLPTGAGFAAGPLTGGIGGAAAAGGAANALSSVPKWLAYGIPAVNALAGSYAAGRAADAQEAGLDRALAENARQFDTTRADFEPWMAAGRDALGQLADPKNFFSASPDYEFRRGEGMRGIENSFAARGMGQSGNALRALTEFNSNLASGEYGDWWNRQANRAGLGANATSTVGALGSAASGRAGNYLAEQGASRASGVLGKYAAVSGAGDDMFRNYLYRRRA